MRNGSRKWYREQAWEQSPDLIRGAQSQDGADAKIVVHSETEPEARHQGGRVPGQ